MRVRARVSLKQRIPVYRRGISFACTDESLFACTDEAPASYLDPFFSSFPSLPFDEVTRDQGDQGTKGTKGPRGPGDQGDQGTKGTRTTMWTRSKHTRDGKGN